MQGAGGSVGNVMSSRTQYFTVFIVYCVFLSVDSILNQAPLVVPRASYSNTIGGTKGLHPAVPAKVWRVTLNPLASVTAPVARGTGYWCAGDLVYATCSLLTTKMESAFQKSHWSPNRNWGIAGEEEVENKCPHYWTRSENMWTNKGLPLQASRIWEIPSLFFLVYVTRSEVRCSWGG